MKRTKRLVALLVAVMLIAATPLSAFAAGPKGYAPTEWTVYYLENGQWVQDTGAKYLATYAKSGKLTSRTTQYSDGESYTTRYTWKGNYITKVTYSNSDLYEIKYKSKLRQTIRDIASDGTVYSTGVYKWAKNKKKGTVTYTFRDGSTSTEQITLTGKKQLKSVTWSNEDGVSTESYKYYGNGNRKSVTYNTSNYTGLYKYNKNGYLTEWVDTTSEGTYRETYKYTMDKKKKAPKEVVITWSSPDGYTDTYKKVYTAYKKVNHLMNCDAFGYGISLG